jgi:voltage-gated sodium channel
MTTEIDQQSQPPPGNDAKNNNSYNNKNNIPLASRLKSFATSHLSASTQRTAAPGSSTSASTAAMEALSSTASYTLATDDPLSYQSHNNYYHIHNQQQKQQPQHYHHPGGDTTDMDDTFSHSILPDCRHTTYTKNNRDDDDVSSTEGIDVLGTEYAPKNYSQWSRLWSGRIVRSWLFKRFVLICIFINSIIMGVATCDVVRDHYHTNRLVQDTIKAFRIFFTCELILELLHYQQGALHMGWIVFDVVTISLSWFVSLTLLVLRSFRLIRALRKASGVADVKTLVKALLRVIPKMLTILFLIFLVFYIFAVIFTDLYQDLYPTYSPYSYNLHDSTSYYDENGDNNNNRHDRRRHLEDTIQDDGDGDGDVVFTYDYFGRLDRTAFTLFQIMTLDGWSDICKQVMQVHPWSCLLFISFIISTSFFFTALIIAVVGEAFHAVREESLFKSLDGNSTGGSNGGGGGSASLTMSQFLLSNSTNNNNGSVRLGKREGLAGKNKSGSEEPAYASRGDVQRLEAKVDDLANTIRHLVRIQSGMQASLQKLALQQSQQQGASSSSSQRSGRIPDSSPSQRPSPTAVASAAVATSQVNVDDHENSDDNEGVDVISCKISSDSKVSATSTIATSSLADVVESIPSERNLQLQSHRSL